MHMRIKGLYDCNKTTVLTFILVISIYSDSANAQVYQTCLATNLYEDSISEVTEGLSPTAAVKGLVYCVKESREQNVDVCQCSVDCSPVGGFFGTRAVTAINQLITELAFEVSKCD